MNTGFSDLFFEKGWRRFPYDAELADWVAHALPAARATVTAPEFAEWRRCQDTWFVGVNALPNDRTGRVDGGPPLSGAAIDFIHHDLGIADIQWDRAQVSVCYPGYPKPMEGESEANFAFRRDRDAAHVDGLRHVGEDRRRYLLERHGFILGIPLAEVGAGASPLVVWEGSHHVIRKAFEEVYDGVDPAEWPSIDITDVYKAARREIFGACRRVTVTAKPGEAYVVHRLALHGIAPWMEGPERAVTGPDGRMIAYFRPETGRPGDWLYAP